MLNWGCGNEGEANHGGMPLWLSGTPECYKDANLDHPQRMIIEQLTVYTPALSDADLFVETQLSGPHLL
jgi:hypothetical protein